MHYHESDNRVLKNPKNGSESVANVFNLEPSTNKPSKDMSKTLRPDALINEDWISDSEDESEIEFVPKQREPSFVTSTEHVKSFREFIKKVEHPKQAANLRTNNQKYRVRMTHPHSNWNVVPTAVLTRSRLVSLNVAIPVPLAVTQSTVNSTWPVKHVVNKAHSLVRRPINQRTSTQNSNFNKKFTTIKVNKVNDVQGNKDNAKKASAYYGNPQQALKDKGVIDSGCSRHMTKNISFLLEFEEINGGYVAFRGYPKGGKISGKGKIKTCKLDFDDVYFVKEHKFNLFSVSQMCDKKNNVFFADTKCVILSFDYKLPDENHVLLRALRENNMYNVDLKNFCGMKWIKREFSIARTPQQNGVAERKNRILIKAARTMLADSLLPIPFWAEVVNTASYVQNRVLVTKPHNKTSYELLLVVAGIQPIDNADPHNTDDDVADASFDVKENENDVNVSANGSDKSDNKKHNEKAKRDDKGKSPIDSLTRVRDLRAEFEEFSFNSSNSFNAVNAPINAVGPNLINSTNNSNTASSSIHAVSPNFGIARKSSFVDPFKYPEDPYMPELEDIVYSDDEEDVDAEADLSNLETNIPISTILTTRVHKDHPVNQIIVDLNLAPQTRSMTRMVKEQGGVHQINDEDFYTCMFACFLSQEEPKKILPKGKRALGSKWVFRNKKDKRGIVIRNKARLLAQGHTQAEGIEYDEIFAPVARIEDIRLFLAYASFMGFMVYQMDVKRLQVKQKDDGIFISQDKYGAEILWKFGFIDVKSASTPIETKKPLLKDPDGEDVDVHIYRSIIGSLMYLTSSRPDKFIKKRAKRGIREVEGE
nr:putative ribonuclease H-like domain-containing protein [Tanacetum cinerariifolium]